MLADYPLFELFCPLEMTSPAGLCEAMASVGYTVRPYRESFYLKYILILTPVLDGILSVCDTRGFVSTARLLHGFMDLYCVHYTAGHAPN